MNLTIAPIPGNRQTARLRHISRVVAATLFIIVITSAAAQAGPVRINQVVQTVSNLQGLPQLTLVSQDPIITGTQGSKQTAQRNDKGVGSSDPKLDSLLSGIKVDSSGLQQIGIETIEEGEVDGTICDCGEILIAGGAFPKWPFAFLAAVPLAFIDFTDDCTDCQQSTPTPTPTPTPPNNVTPTPEPASLLLFGTGLLAFGAGLRRRHTKAKLGNQKTEASESE